MFLFIFENVGTSELLLVGVVALIFLGPRRMPEMAKKVGKFMAQFRGTANEFKETWRREVDLENASKHFDLANLEAEATAEAKPIAKSPDGQPPAAAQITEVPAEKLAELKQNAERVTEANAKTAAAANDKQNWL